VPFNTFEYHIEGCTFYTTKYCLFRSHYFSSPCAHCTVPEKLAAKSSFPPVSVELTIRYIRRRVYLYSEWNSFPYSILKWDS